MAQRIPVIGADGADNEDSERNNPVLHMLARQLDLAPPGELPAGYRG